jgi:hypothetical protein
MKRKYVTPMAQSILLEEKTCLLAGSSVSVSNDKGNFESDDKGGYVVNSRPGFTLWNED